MTLLGELYANGLGVPQDDKKAAEWYKLAADRGDADAMFALAMFRLDGRAGPRDRERAPNGSPPRPSSASRSPLTIWRCSISRANCSRRISTAPPNCCASPRRPAIRKRNMRSARSTRTAAACRRTCTRRCSCSALAALADNTDAEVEYAIALYNGDGVDRNQKLAAALFRKAALQGTPIAQDRLAHILASGLGAPADPVEAAKWHLISKARGETDLALDDFVAKLDPDTRAAGEAEAKKWIDALRKPPA